MNVYARQLVEACLTSGIGIFPPLDLMPPPLESEPLPLESAPLDTVHPLSDWAPLEMVVLGVCEYLLLGVCEICAVFRGI